MRRLGLRLFVLLLSFSLGSVITFWFRQKSGRQPIDVTAGYQSPTGSTSPKTATDGRDLSLYDPGGHQGCGNVLVKEVPRCQASLRRARAFIWEHWQQKKRGYVTVKMASVDAESDAHIFIEPDNDGAWHVVWKWERIFAASMGEDVSGRIDQIPDIRSIQLTADNACYFCTSRTTYLLFFAADGTRIQEL
ncbi:MAG: hypothetical protein ND895_28325 [Pyrinomonadaceae bacterium]|nr:hypothetical protein [Pyrinomonadaceae bacterium]